MSSLLPLISAYLKALFASIAIILLPVIVYRLKLHPLSRYPGPFFGKLSDLYITYHILKGNLHVQQRLLHEDYGPVVLIGPNRLMFDSSKALHEIYTSRNVKKSAGYTATDPVPGFSNVFTSVDKNLYRVKRKALSPGFSEQFIRKFENVITENVDTFISPLAPAEAGSRKTKGWSEAHNMSDRCKYFTLDVMGVFGFGKSFDTQRTAMNHGSILGMRAGGIISGIYAQMPELRRLNLHKYFKIGGTWTQARSGSTADHPSSRC